MSLSDFTIEQSFQCGRTMTVRRVNYVTWLLKLVAWDGVLPVAVLLMPTVVETLFPNRRGVMEVAAVTVPILVFFIRFFVAKRHIFSNQCTGLVRGIQLVALCVAILVLLLIDSFIILAHEMPKGAMFATDTDLLVWAVLIAVYVTCMAFAMFPGSTEELTTVEWRDVDPLSDHEHIAAT
jgi:hypothetical protein